MTNKLITVVAVTYGQMPYKLPAFVYNILGQHLDCWKLIVLHDGPSIDGTKEFILGLNHPDITYVESDIRGNCWGHQNRHTGLMMVDTPFVWFQNCDNLITYDATRYLHPHLNDTVDLVTFPIVHSHFDYSAFYQGFAYGQMDMAQFVVRTSLAQSVGFNHRDFAADGWFIEDLKSKYPYLHNKERSVFIPAIITVHT